MTTVNLAVRFVLELCALAALSCWGAQTGDQTWSSVALGVTAPLVAATAWGVFVSPKARVDIPVLRWIVELAVFAAAVLGLVDVDQAGAAIALGGAYVVNRALLVLWGREAIRVGGAAR